MFLTLFFLLNAVVFAETWDSFSTLEQGKVYLFEEDSLKEIVSADGDISHWLYEKNVIVPYCDKVCTDAEGKDYFCSLLCGVRWNGSDTLLTEDIVWSMSYSFECQSESMKNFEPMRNMIQDGDASQISFFQWTYHTDLASEYTVCISEYINEPIFDSVITHAFIYQKKDYYHALCYLYETNIENDSVAPLYAMYCIYQDDETWNFSGSPQMKNVDWMNRNGKTSLIRLNNSFDCKQNSIRCSSSKYLGRRINGTSASECSSNVIIKNKQPTLQLKGCY